MKNKILVTGVNGFIGSSLKRYLKKYRKYDIYGIDKKRGMSGRYCTCDLKNKNKLSKILKDIRPCIIFHMAGGRSRSKEELVRSNYTPTKNLLDTISSIDNFYPIVIIPGTAAEYGKVSAGKAKITEKVKTKPQVPYGRIKLQQTGLSLEYVKKGVDVRVARLFNILGKRTPNTLVAGRLSNEIVKIERGKASKKIKTGRLDGIRDFLDIEDICRGLCFIAQYGKKGEIYNVCSGRALKIRGLLEEFLKSAKVKDIIIEESKHDTSPSFSIVGSNAKLKRLSKWQPRISIRKGIQNTLNSYRSTKK